MYLNRALGKQSIYRLTGWKDILVIIIFLVNL
jgi:hypothetical protein